MNISLFSLSGEVDSNNTLHVSSNYVSNNEKGFFSSIQAALDYAQKSETETSIILDDRVYYIDRMLSIDGNRNVTIEGNGATITSGQLVDNNNIAVHGDTLIIPVKSLTTKLLKNGKEVPLATTFLDAEHLQPLISIEQVHGQEWISEFSAQELAKLEPGCDVFIYVRWKCYKFTVVKINPNNKVVLRSADIALKHLNEKYIYYSVYNSRKLLRPGYFCCNNNKLYYLLTEGESTENIEFRIPKQPALLLIERSSNISIRNTVFQGATIANWYFQASQGAVGLSQAVVVRQSHDISFERCKFHQNMGYSLYIGHNSYSCTVEGCEFTDLQGGGLFIGYASDDKTNNIIVRNNLIMGYGKVHVSSEGILAAKANHVSISNNTICDGYYTGITVGWTWGFGKSYSYNNHISGNNIHHILRGVLSDGAAIYTLGDQNGTIIENNYIHDIISRRPYEGAGIYFDEGTSNCIARNNVIFGTHIGINEHYGENNRIESNYVAFTNYAGFWLSTPEKDIDLTAVDNSLMLDVGSICNINFAIRAIKRNNKVNGVIIPHALNYYYTDLPTNLTITKNLFNVNYLVRKGFLSTSFSYGVQDKTLKSKSGMSPKELESDRQFVLDNFKDCSHYFKDGIDVGK